MKLPTKPCSRVVLKRTAEGEKGRGWGGGRRSKKRNLLLKWILATTIFSLLWRHAKCNVYIYTIYIYIYTKCYNNHLQVQWEFGSFACLRGPFLNSCTPFTINETPPIISAGADANSTLSSGCHFRPGTEQSERALFQPLKEMKLHLSVCPCSKSKIVMRGRGLTAVKCHLLACTERPMIRTAAWLILCHLSEWTCSQGPAWGEAGWNREIHNLGKTHTFTHASRGKGKWTVTWWQGKGRSLVQSVAQHSLDAVVQCSKLEGHQPPCA